MGNALSPFLANLYMANFEMVLKRGNLLRKLFVRYADDIFCVINRRKVSTLLSLLNSQNPSIKFTCEKEVDVSLPFLDVRVTRRESRLEFDVYRRPTSTQRSIPITSCHPMEHTMSHRACNHPLSRENFAKKKWHTSRRRQGSMDVLKQPLTGSCRNTFSNVRSRKSFHCHPSAKRL
jgi:hypothetical protein